MRPADLPVYVGRRRRRVLDDAINGFAAGPWRDGYTRPRWFFGSTRRRWGVAVRRRGEEARTRARVQFRNRADGTRRIAGQRTPGIRDAPLPRGTDDTPGNDVTIASARPPPPVLVDAVRARLPGAQRRRSDRRRRRRLLLADRVP